VDQTDQTDSIWYPSDTRPDTSPIYHIRCTLAHANSHVFQPWSLISTTTNPCYLNGYGLVGVSFHSPPGSLQPESSIFLPPSVVPVRPLTFSCDMSLLGSTWNWKFTFSGLSKEPGWAPGFVWSKIDEFAWCKAKVTCSWPSVMEGGCFKAKPGSAYAPILVF